MACCFLAPPALAADKETTFQVTGIGGAGGMYTPTVSPNDPNLMFISCDMSGVYRSADGGKSWAMLHWRELSDALHCRPAFTRDAIYWATGNALKVSHDKGLTWTRVVQGQQPWKAVIDAIAVDGANVYIGGDEGIFASSNAGKTFSKSHDGKCNNLVAVGKSVYAVVDNSVMALEGRSWKKLDAGSTIASLAGGAENGGAPLLYAGGKEGINQSIDGGKTWHNVFKTPVQMIVMSPGQTQNAWAAERHKVFVTNDQGKTWASTFRMEGTDSNVDRSWVQTQLHWGYYVSPLGLSVSPTDPNVAFVSTQGDFYITRNGGEHWSQLMNNPVGKKGGDPGFRYACNGLEVTSSWEYLFDPNDANRTYIAYTDIGFARSVDRGQTWISSTNGCPWSNTFYQVVFDPTVKGRLYAACSTRHDIPHWNHLNANNKTQIGGVCQSDDYGANWKVLGKGSLPEFPCTSIAIDPKSPSGNLTMYVTLYEGGVYKSTDNGKTWKKKSNGLGNKGNMHAFMVKIQPKTGDLYCSITAMRENQTDFPVAGGLWKSSDGGDTWTDITKPLALKWATGFALDPNDPNTIYLAAATAPHTPQGGLYKTTDGGKNWKHVIDDATFAKNASPSFSQCMFVTLHPDNPSVVYLSTGSHGLWISKDAGKSFNRIEGIPFRSIDRVTFDPRDHHTLYVTTFGGGVWKGAAE
jgi:photosystem II stability/assembly factor-like uncharacterized protein